MRSKLVTALLALPAAVLVGACGGASEQPALAQSPAGPCQNVDFRTCMAEQNTPPPTVIDPAKAYTATVHTSQGDFVLKLDPKAAPVTVNNFVYLSQHGYYDGLTFHRVVPGFVVQGGDPSGNGTGGPGYKLPDETNPAPWLKGSLGMASSPAGVNGSQFFVLIGDAPHLTGAGTFNHFGTVSSGQDVVDQIKVGAAIKSIDIAAS